MGRRQKKRLALGLAAFAGLSVPLGAALLLFLLQGGDASSDRLDDVPDAMSASLMQPDAAASAGIDLPHPSAAAGLIDVPAPNMMFAVDGSNASAPDDGTNVGNFNADGYQPDTGASQRPRHPDHPQSTSPFGLSPHGGPVVISGGAPTGGSRAPDAGSPKSTSPESKTPETDAPENESKQPDSPTTDAPGTDGSAPETPTGNGGPTPEETPAGNSPGGSETPAEIVPIGVDPQTDNLPAQSPVNTVPEPGALALVLSALGILAWNRRKQR